MQARVIPIGEDGVWGDAIVHDQVTSYDHEQVDADGRDNREVLVLQVGDDTHRYPLDCHWVEITPDRPVAEPEPVGDEVPDDLNRTPDEVRAQFEERQAAVEKLRRQILDRHNGDAAAAKAEFEQWSEGVEYETADLVMVGKYWSHLQPHN